MPIQRFSVRYERLFSTEKCSSRTAIGQDRLAAISDEGESTGKTGGADGANEAGNGSEGELHFK